MRQTKRMISFLLALALVLGAVSPIAVRAEETEPIVESTMEETVPETVALTTEVTEETVSPSEEETVPTEPVATESVVKETEFVEEPTGLVKEDQLGIANDEEGAYDKSRSILGSGFAGNNVQWEFDSSTDTLRFFGSGVIWSSTSWGRSNTDIPWYTYRLIIKNIVVEDGVEAVGDCALFYAEKLEHVSIGKDVSDLKTGSIKRCETWTSLYVSPQNEHFKTDDRGVLYSKDGKTLILCPNGITGICNIPEGVTLIGDAAFSKCAKLTGVTIPETVVSIGTRFNVEGNRYTPGAFQGCTGLKNITIPNGVTEIGDRTFSESGLTSITIPDSVTRLGKFVFLTCKDLTDVTIGDGVVSIGNQPFAFCESLASVTLGSSVSSISTSAFIDCKSLKSITIPKNVETIEYGAFEGCNSLQEIQVDPENEYYSSVDGVLYSLGGKILHTFPAGRQNGTFRVPKGVVGIGESAFRGCLLDRVVLPEGVTAIGKQAFYYHYSANKGYAVRSVVIPVSVTNIGAYCFSDSFTKDIYYIGDKSQWNQIAIDSSIKYVLENIRIHYNGSIEAGSFANGLRWEFYHSGMLDISGSGEMLDFQMVEDIPWCHYRAEITEVIIHNGITRIGGIAFQNCINLETIVLPGSLGAVGDGAFHGCKALREGIFHGEEKDYRQIDIGMDNDPLLQAKIRCQYLSDFIDNKAITINEAGSATAYYLGEPNQEICYKLNDTQYMTVSNDDGVVAIGLGDFATEGTHAIDIELIKVGDLELNPHQVLTSVVTVTDFAFSQSWKISLDAKVKAQLAKGFNKNVPAHELEINLFTPEVGLGIGVSSEMTRIYENGKNALELMSKVAAKAGASVKSGITNKTNTSKFSWGKVSAGVDINGSVNYGLRIDNYNRTDKDQNLAVGLFYLEQLALALPGALLLNDFYAELRNEAYEALDIFGHNGITCLDGSAVTAAVNGKISGSALKVNDKTLLEAGSLSGNVAIGLSESSNNAGGSSRSASYKSATAVGDILAGDMPFHVKREGLGLKLASQDMTVTSSTSNGERSLSIKSVDRLSGELRVLNYGQAVWSGWYKYTFKDGSLSEIMSHSAAARDYVNGDLLLLTASEMAEIAQEVTNAHAPISYVKENHQEKVFSIPFEFKIPGTETGFGITASAMESTDITTETGFAAMDQQCLVSTSVNREPHEYEKWEFDDFFGVMLDGLEELAKEFFEEFKDTIQEGIDAGKAWITGIPDSIHNWSVEILTSVEGSARRSYRIAAARYAVLSDDMGDELSDDSSLEEESDNVATVGKAFIVNVIDNKTGEHMDEFAVEPLTFTIRYTAEDLNAAGLHKDSPIVQSGGIAMYRYNDNGGYFEYIGGTNDLDAMTVTAEITSPGQYVLAVDACAPTVQYLDISDFHQTPTITAYIDDLSGLSGKDFRFCIDGVEKVNGSNLSDHYNIAAGIFTYTVPETEKLSEGEHTLSFTLGDTSENVDTYEYAFTVDLTAPVISDATVSGFANKGSVVTIRAQVSDPNLTAVYAVLSKQQHDGSWGQEVINAMNDMGDGLWGLDYEADGSVLRVVVKVVDIAENETNSDMLEANPAAPGDLNLDGEVDSQDALYLLWHALFKEDYPLCVEADFNHDTVTDGEDAEYLVWHILFPNMYPLN